jgi:MFS family permease
MTSGNRLESPFSYSDWMLPGPRGAQRVQPNVILAVLSLAALTYAILSSAVIPALPTIQHSLHASETGITWLLTGFLLSASVGTAIIGKLGDMYGKQRLLVWTLLILAAGTLLAALAGSLPVLIVGRVIQGVAGGIFPLAFAIVRDEFPADRVAGSIGLMSVAFLLGAGLYAWFLLLPQLAQFPLSTGFGYGASVVAAGLYLLPCALGMGVLASLAGRVERRFGSRRALIAGAAVSAAACGWLAFASTHPYDMLLSSTLLGIGIGLAFAALGNLIVQAVPPYQTGVASGMNTVLRTLGGALGGQIAATFVAASTVHGLPTLTGFTQTFAMSALFLACCAVAGLLIPTRAPTVTSLPSAATSDAPASG